MMGGGLGLGDVHNPKGRKRKRGTTIGGREVDDAQASSDGDEHHHGQDSQGIVLCWGTAKGGSVVDDLASNDATQLEISRKGEGHSTMLLRLSRGLEDCSGSSDDTFLDFGRSRLLKDATDGQGSFLQLGQTVAATSSFSEGRVRGGWSAMSNDGEDVHLGLAPAGNASEMARFETTLDGIPVVDEGSSSARLLKSGGFMPALLMGSPINLIPSPQSLLRQPQHPTPHVSFPELRSYRDPEDQAAEQDLMISFRASTSGGTTSTSGTSGVSDRAGKVCKFRGCSKGSRGASGLCIAHGGGQRCEKTGCNKGAEGRTVYCKAHGGGRRCQNLGCTKSAEGKTDYCIGHGGGRRCSHEGCDKAARGRSGLCIRHGGGKRCLTEGCTKSAEGYSGLCISHGGGRRCQKPGCSKGAQGSTMFCKAHGGGKRCMIQGCNKGAEGSTPLCKGHGGGKRCRYDGGGICAKSVHGGTLYCVAHGGGKRCQVDGCSKSARGRTDFCVRHGGGKRCKVDACGKSAQGSTDFCKAHGGGKRCQWGADGEAGKGEVCDKFARGKTGLCAAHSALVHDRKVHGGIAVLGPGLTPGLFRGLVSAASMGTSSASHTTYSSSTHGESSSGSKEHGTTMCSGQSGQFLSTSRSGRGDASMSLNASAVIDGGFSNSTSLVDHLSASTASLELQRGSPPRSVTPSFPAGFSIGQPLIPPQVLVPLSMQRKDSGSSRHGLPPRPPVPACDDGVVSRFSIDEGRVHGGGLMALLAREARGAGAGVDLISLGMGTSSMDVRWSPSSPSVVEGSQRMKDFGSLGADVGQFLAGPRVNFR